MKKRSTYKHNRREGDMGIIRGKKVKNKKGCKSTKKKGGGGGFAASIAFHTNRTSCGLVYLLFN
jgi:hypothetical protein